MSDAQYGSEENYTWSDPVERRVAQPNPSEVDSRTTEGAPSKLCLGGRVAHSNVFRLSGEQALPLAHSSTKRSLSVPHRTRRTYFDKECSTKRLAAGTLEDICIFG